MPRSLKKGPFVHRSILKKILLTKSPLQKSKVFKTWSRATVILPEFIGMTFAIHNGKKFIPLFITENCVGHKLGEFAVTRTFHGHSGSGDKKDKA
jgi:small subunit ribosomal protein S19